MTFQGHHAGLRRRISGFTNGLLESDPAIPGLDETIIINPRRLHFTLGVMSLDSNDDSGTSGDGTRPKTLESAARLLDELRPGIMKILEGEKLSVGLDVMDIMKQEGNDLEKAHVLWTGPGQEGENARRLREVSSKCPRVIIFPGFMTDWCRNTDFIHDEFMKAGLLIDENRPLKVSCQKCHRV